MTAQPQPLSVGLLWLVIVVAGSTVLPAELSRREANRLAVDVVTLKSGEDLRGIIAGRTATEVQLIVRVDWLADQFPDLLPDLQQRAAQRDQQLIDRIDEWLLELTDDLPADAVRTPGEHPPDVALIGILKAERETYQQYVDEPLSLPPGEGTTRERQEAYRQLVARFDRWIGEIEGQQPGGADQLPTPDSSELVRILQTERATFAARRTQSQPEHPSRFVLVALSRDEVQRVFAQSDARRKLALAAFLQQIDDVETATLATMQQELAARGVDWQQSDFDLSQLIGPSTLQDERQWAARRAIYEYQFLRRLEFQGTGNLIVQTGDDAPPPNIAQLLQEILGQQQALALGDLLEEPIFTGLDFGGLGVKPNENRWLQQAARTAERAGLHGFRITRVQPDIGRRRSVVEDRFLAQMPDGSWETVWMTRQTKAAGAADPSDIDRIRQDPQLREILDLADGLGLRGPQLDLALQFGASTMNAQQSTDDAFYEFRDRYSKRLDGPPLTWEQPADN